MTTSPSFGIMTAPMQVDYRDIAEVWREADAIPEIEHAWLFDHLMPIGGDPDGPILEGWTLLSALAAQTERLRLGLLVSSNRFRPPAVLAKIAATVDIVSGGRLDFGLGSGSRPSPPSPGANTMRTACPTSPRTERWTASPIAPHAVPCSTATVPRSAGIPRPSPARFTCRSPTTTPKPPEPRSPRPWTPDSVISCWVCPIPIRRVSPAGSPTKSSR